MTKANFLLYLTEIHEYNQMDPARIGVYSLKWPKSQHRLDICLFIDKGYCSQNDIFYPLLLKSVGFFYEFNFMFLICAKLSIIDPLINKKLSFDHCSTDFGTP